MSSINYSVVTILSESPTKSTANTNSNQHQSEHLDSDTKWAVYSSFGS